jgi:aminoglycoside phosphotransferase family enzyme
VTGNAPHAAGSEDAAACQSSLVTLAFLLSPDAHAPGSGPIESIETHMSWLVLDAHQVLKLKKPVCYPPLLDYRSLAAREQDARAELRLNRRLAPDVYQGLLAVRREHGHSVLRPEAALPAAGETVDWVVQMQRLPAERMLDRLLATGQLQPAQPAVIEALALVLARFYQHALPATVEPEAHLQRFQAEMARHRQVLAQARFGLAEAGPVLDRAEAALVRQAPALRQRVRQGHIVDGHGDLRAEHVCLVDPPVVIDCLAFNDALRQVDPFEELTALALECERMGARWVGDLLIERCSERLDDQPSGELLQFYRVDRALLRARLAVAHLLDRQATRQAHWLALGRCYLTLAGVQAGRLA